MISISKQMDGHDIAAQVRMERQSHKGSFLLLEGDTDQRRLVQFVNQSRCAIVCCFGKKNVLVAIDQLYENGFAGALGLVDADFDRVIGTVVEHEGIVYSDFHDFDTDVVLSAASARYLVETSDPRKLASLGPPTIFVTTLMSTLKPIAAMKLANERENLGYSFKGLNLDLFFDGANLDIDSMIASVSGGRYSSQAYRDRLKDRIIDFQKLPFDLKQATSGHDLCAAIGVCLRGYLGSRLPPQTWRNEVELHFRLTYSRDDFEQSRVFRAIREWERANPLYVILN